MQAVIIQQDSISEIHQVMVESAFNARDKRLKAWQEVRLLRNTCAGHPAKKEKTKRDPLTRTFMSRNFGGYDALTYHQWHDNRGTTHPRVRLGAWLDAYAAEAGVQLTLILAATKNRWP
jgi:hypothetical protein